MQSLCLFHIVLGHEVELLESVGVAVGTPCVGVVRGLGFLLVHVSVLVHDEVCGGLRMGLMSVFARYDV